MQLPTTQELSHQPRFAVARKHWAINAGLSWLSVIGFLATVLWTALAIFAGRSWLLVIGLLGASLFAASVAREYRRASARSIGDQIGLEGIPVEMEQWGALRVAPKAMKQVDAWHNARYGGKTDAELAALAREDERDRKALEDFDREQRKG